MGMHVLKVYYVPHLDRLALVGRPEGRPPVPGGSIDLPREIRGPGWVPIFDVQQIPFADGLRTAVILEYHVVEGAPLMEFSDLEGKTLETRS